LQEVPIPQNVDPKGKRRTLRDHDRRTSAALVTANDRINQGRDCVDDQRQLYANQKSPGG
jgi:hypothetical protein